MFANHSSIYVAIIYRDVDTYIILQLFFVTCLLSLLLCFSMPKQKPTTSKTGKRQQSKKKTNQGNQRLSQIIARAISSDAGLLEEIQSLLPQKETYTQPQIETDHPQIETEQLATLDLPSDLDNTCSTSSLHDDHLLPEVGEAVDLGAFSTVHPPVDKATRQKIYNLQYVDLSALLFKSSIFETTTIKKSANSITTSIQTNQANKITSIITWCRAFQLYADIYCGKYPTQSSELFRYMSIIQTLAQNSFPWQQYDEKFRQLRSVNPLPWGNIHTETYLFCSMLAKSQPFRGQQSSATRLPLSVRHRKGFCWEFQDSGRCLKSKCTLQHVCSNCNGSSHGASRCFKPCRRISDFKTQSPSANKHRSVQKHT